MERTGNWFSSVKKALSPDSKEKKHKKSKSKKQWFGNQKQSNPESALEDVVTAPPPQPVELKSSCVVNEESSCGGSIEVPTAGSVTASVAASANVPDMIQIPPKTQFSGKSMEEVAAIKIQTAYRRYLARRALRALRGVVRLEKLMEGSVVKRQAANTLQCMQTLARVQSQIRFRRIRMLEETQALQKQLLQKHAKELEMGEEWDDSFQSKEQIEANLLSKYEAAMRRERAMAYSFSHQQTWKNSSRFVNPMFMDPSDPNWGWSWLERWTAARPWESRAEKEPSSEKTSTKSVRRSFSPGEIGKSYTKYQLNAETNSPTARAKANKPTFESPSTPSKPALPASTRETKAPSPRSSRAVEDEWKSVASVQSDRPRRHNMEGGSSVRDDESMGSSQAVPSYMTPTKSTRARSKSQSPFTMEKSEALGKESPAPPKKRLSLTPSPALGKAALRSKKQLQHRSGHLSLVT